MPCLLFISFDCSRFFRFSLVFANILGVVTTDRLLASARPLQVMFNLFEQLSAPPAPGAPPARDSSSEKKRVLEAISVYAMLGTPEVIAPFYTRLAQMYSESVAALTATPSGDCYVLQCYALLSLKPQLALFDPL